MALRIENLLDDIKTYRDDMVARNYPFQEISNIIIKWETELQEEKEYLAKEQSMADWAESFKEKDE